MAFWVMPCAPPEKPIGMRRPVADTMPSVTLNSSPKGAPIATAFWPTASLSESPSGMGLIRPAGSLLGRMRARSYCGARPITVAE